MYNAQFDIIYKLRYLADFLRGNFGKLDLTLLYGSSNKDKRLVLLYILCTVRFVVQSLYCEVYCTVLHSTVKTNTMFVC